MVGKSERKGLVDFEKLIERERTKEQNGDSGVKVWNVIVEVTSGDGRLNCLKVSGKRTVSLGDKVQDVMLSCNVSFKKGVPTPDWLCATTHEAEEMPVSNR